jgi:hypothetical protein
VRLFTLHLILITIYFLEANAALLHFTSLQAQLKSVSAETCSLTFNRTKIFHLLILTLKLKY